MPITFNCTCGKILRVPDETAGRRAKCPACNAVVNVPRPEPEPEFEIVEETAPAAAGPIAKPHGKPVVDDDSDDGTTYGLASEKSKHDDDDDDGGSRRSSPRGKSGLPNFRKGKDNYT
jgi:hypothetical protein